jgi:chitodextrinase
VFKLNYNENGTLVSDEAADIALPTREWELLHDNVMMDKTIVVRTSTGGTGITITDFTTQTGSKPWKTKLVFGSTVNVGTYFISYYSQGDQNDADDLNTLAGSVGSLINSLGPFSGIQADLDAIQQSVNQVQSGINATGTLQQSIDAIQQSVNDIPAIHTSILNAIVSLQTDVDKNLATGTAVDGLQQSINQMSTVQSTITNSLNLISTNVQSESNSTNALQQTINSIQQTVNDMPTIHSSILSAITSLQTDVDTNVSTKQTVSTLQQSINQISTVQTTIIDSLNQINNKVQNIIDTGGTGGGGGIISTNTPPNISTTFNKVSALTSDVISIPYTVYDAEGGVLTATYNKDGVLTTATIGVGNNSWNVGILSAGVHTLSIAVQDSGSMISNTLVFTITVAVPNTAPAITSSYSTTITVADSSQVSIPYSIVDAEGGSMTATYTKDGVASTSTVPTGSNTWSIGTLPIGIHTLTIQVADSGGLSSNKLTFNITVQSTNTAPGISSSFNTTSVSDTTVVSIPYTITDADSNTFTATYTIDSTITTATVTNNSAVIWNVGNLPAGNHTLSIQVKDGGNLASNTLTFNITVTGSNTAPSIGSSYTTTSVYPTDTISIPYTVTDAQGGSMTATYTIDGVPTIATASTGANTWSVGALAIGSHTLSIQVKDNTNLTSNTLSFFITSANDVTPPNEATNLSVTNRTSTSVSLSWTGSSSSDLQDYQIYQGNTLLATITGTTYTVTGLADGTTYMFTVKSRDKSGNVSAGIGITTTTIDITAPNNVTSLVASNVTTTSVSLNWVASTSPDISSYQIYQGSTLLSTVTGVSYVISGLNSSTSYTFTVKSRDTSGNLSIGVNVTATTSAPADVTPPNDVTSLSASNLTDRSVTLSWTASTSTDVASYMIYEGSTLVTSTSATSYTVTGLASNTQYTFIVKSKDTSGNVSVGTLITFTTILSQGTVLVDGGTFTSSATDTPVDGGDFTSQPIGTAIDGGAF